MGVSEHRPRRRRIVNPEHLYDALIEMLNARDDAAFDQAVNAARQLVGLPPKLRLVEPPPPALAPIPVADPINPTTPLERVFDPGLSAQPCGCDPGAGYSCDQHRA